MIAAALTLTYSLALLFLSLYALRALLLALAWMAVRRRAEPPANVAELPTVTVQLPIFNEPCVAARVIDAACRLDWPRDRFEVQILDDSTDETRAIVDASARAWQARGVDVVAVRRADRAGYKAGALAAGLAQARGDVLAIFDADFVPAPDFLRRTVPYLGRGVAAVQARWDHLNHSDTWLTRAQALALDGYFMIEQTVHARFGLWLNFNGTAGIWRRAAIDAAGGWQGDTLTEDVDLSYRAQVAGWRIVLLPDVAVPAELPATLPAYRRQQQRWAKGTIQVLRKLGPRLWRCDRPLVVRLLAVVTLGGYLVYPVTLGLLLGAPLLLAFPPHFPTALGIVTFAPFGPLTMYAAAQASIPQRRWRRLLAYPYLVLVTIGTSLAGTRAVMEAIVGRSSAFERTPKTGSAIGAPFGTMSGADAGSPPIETQATPRASGPGARALADRTVLGELGLAVYAWAGLLAALGHDAGGMVVFFAIYALGFTLTTVLGLRAGAGFSGAGVARRATAVRD